MLITQHQVQLDDRPIGRRERRDVSMHGFLGRQDGSTAAVRVTDLSYDGCGVETAAELEPGERVDLAVLGRGAIAAVVRWCIGGRAGLAFEAAPAIQKRPSRRSERTPLAAEVTLRSSGRPTYRVPVLDLSPHGCRVEVVERPEIGDQLWIKFAGLETLEATVRWVAGSKAGLRFANPIHPAVFDLLLDRYRGAGAAGQA